MIAITVAIAITTSGNSKNLIKAANVANKKGIYTFCFSGNGGGKLKKNTKFPIIIPSKNTSQIQVVEILIGQVYCEILENFFAKSNNSSLELISHSLQGEITWMSFLLA